MRKLFCLSLMIVLLFLPTPTVAKVYIEGGISSTSLDYHGHDNCRTVGPKVVLGWQALKNVSVEGHYMEGNGREDYIKFEIRTMSLFAKLNLFTSCESTDKERVQLYALLGWTQLETKFPKRIPDSRVEGETLSRTEKIDSFSYGAGFLFPISKRTFARAEFNNLVDDGFWHSTELSLRVGIKF
jgi:hypothetical protein